MPWQVLVATKHVRHCHRCSSIINSSSTGPCSSSQEDLSPLASPTRHHLLLHTVQPICLLLLALVLSLGCSLLLSTQHMQSVS